MTRCPIHEQRQAVFEDVVNNRESAQSLGKPGIVRSLVVIGNAGFKGRLKNRLMRCEVADDPVVVSKPRPVKAGNSVEDKTETMISGDLIKMTKPKAFSSCEGVK